MHHSFVQITSFHQINILLHLCQFWILYRLHELNIFYFILKVFMCHTSMAALKIMPTFKQSIVQKRLETTACYVNFSLVFY